MIWTRHVTVIFCLTVFLLLPGCQRKDRENQPTDVNDEIICPMLYQRSGSFTDALRFIEVPEDRMETYLSSVSRRGRLADQHELPFANRLFSLRKSKDADMFISMLSDGTRKQLDDDNNKRMAHRYIEEIKDGTFLYGEWDFNFFVTFCELTRGERDALQRDANFAQSPSHVVHYWHFHKPKYMLIGAPFYLIKDKDSYKVVTETWLQGELTPVAKRQEASGPKEYGIVAFTQIDDAYAKRAVWKYQWDVELNLDESEGNKFEILKLTKVSSAQDDIELHPDIAKQVLTEESVFDKYKYKELKCRFYVGDKEPSDNSRKYGQRLSSWGCGFGIASMYRGSSMFVPGKDITNVKVNRNGSFVGYDLEFMSFETIEEDVQYRHRVVLRKNPIIANPDS